MRLRERYIERELSFLWYESWAAGGVLEWRVIRDQTEEDASGSRRGMLGDGAVFGVDEALEA